MSLATDEAVVPAVRKRRARISPRPAWVFLAFALVVGTLLAFVTPPLQVPDEEGHLFRAYQVSTGRLADRRMGADVPVSLLQLAHVFQRIKFRSDLKETVPEIRAQFGKPLNPGSAMFLGLPGASIYSPVPYTGQAIGMAIGRGLGWSPIGVFYAGRVGNAWLYALLGWGAITALPMLKWPACIILTAPLPLTLAGSLSADPTTLSLSVLAIGLLLRVACGAGEAPVGTQVGLLVAMVAMSLCKSVYAPIALMVAVVPAARWGPGARRWAWPVGIVAAVVLAAGIWSALASPMRIQQRSGDPARQLHWVAYHPGSFLGALERTYLQRTSAMAGDAVGRLGWGEFVVSLHFLDAFYFVLFWMVIQDDSPVPLRAPVRWAALGAALLCILTIGVSVFLLWHLPGERLVEGIQGRYLLVVGFLMCVVFRRRGTAGIRPGWMVLLLAVSWAYTLWLIVGRFYLPGA